MSAAFPRVYAILDAGLLGETLGEAAVAVTAAGVRLLQYRDKTSSPAGALATLRRLLALPGRDAVRWIANDRADLAAIAGADGVHVGQGDLSAGDARQLMPAPRWVGISAHSEQQISRAAAMPVDYIAVGPIYPTATKANPGPAVGLGLLRTARKITQKPIVAIGGITIETCREVYAAGADCAAVAGDLCRSGDPGSRATAYLKLASEFF